MTNGLPKTTPRTFGGLTVRKASDIGPEGTLDWGLCMGLYGKPGSGKTTLAATLAGPENKPDPRGAPVCFADVEGGTNVIAHRSDIDVIDFRTWADLRTFAQTCLTEDVPWRSIVLDNFCEMAQLEMLTRVARGATPELRDYQLNTTNMLASARFWRDLSRTKGINVVIIFWDETEKSEQSSIWETGFALTPKLANRLPGILDTVGYLEVADRTEERTLQLAPSRRYSTKFRRAPTSQAMKIPSSIIRPNLAEILAVLKGGEDWDASKHQTVVKQAQTPTKEATA